MSFGFPLEAAPSDTPLWQAIQRLLPGTLFPYLMGLLLAVGGAFLVQRISYALVLIRDRSFLPFLFFFLLLSTNALFFPLRSTSLALFCLMLALYLLFTTHHDPLSVKRSFVAAFLIGLGSLLWAYMLWYIPLFWIGMYMFRSLNPKTFMASLIGVTVVYWLLLAWAVWTGDYSYFIVPFQSLGNFDLFFWRFSEWIEWLPLLIVVPLVIAAFVNMVVHELADSLRTREFLSFLMLMIAWSVVFFFLYEPATVGFLQMMAIPASTLIAHLFATRQNRYTFWLMIVTIIALPALLILQLSWSF